MNLEVTSYHVDGFEASNGKGGPEKKGEMMQSAIRFLNLTLFGLMLLRPLSGDAKTPPRVWLFKQWHADARIDTHDRAQAKLLPQAAHQAALYLKLDEWIAHGKLGAVVAEGCSGELSRESTVQFNGWTVAELEKQTGKPGYAGEIVGSVPQKLEAKYGARLKTICGDDDALVKAHLLAFSDVRGTLGFLSRLIENKGNPAKARTYLDGVVELYQMPKATTYDQAVKRTRTEAGQAYLRLKDALDRRNRRAVQAVREALKASPKLPVAVVYGGVHASGILTLLRAEGIQAEAIEVEGYKNDEVALAEQLDRAFKQLSGE